MVHVYLRLNEEKPLSLKANQNIAEDVISLASVGSCFNDDDNTKTCFVRCVYELSVDDRVFSIDEIFSKYLM